MRPFLIAATVVAFVSQASLAVPTNKPKGTFSVTSRGSIAPRTAFNAAKDSPRHDNADASGGTAVKASPHSDGRRKEKLLDTSFQLDQYLNNEGPGRTMASTNRRLRNKLNDEPAISSNADVTNSSGSSVAKGSDGMSVSRSSKKRLASKGGRSLPIATIQRNRRLAFEQQWKAQNLHTGIDPAVLAEKVFRLRGHGIDARTLGTHATEKVRAKKDKAYETQYLFRMKRLSQLMSKEMKILKSDPEFTDLSPKARTKMAMEETFKKYASGSRRRNALSRNDPTAPVAYKEEAAQNIALVGKLAQEHLKAKKLDFDELTLDELEMETRKLEVPGMQPQQVTGALNRFIQHAKGADNVDMARIKLARKNHVTAEWLSRNKHRHS